MEKTHYFPPDKKSHVVVIGAGFSGLTAAYRLYQQGYENIEIYEARGRVGGRVFSVGINGPREETIVELGGQNIPDGGDATYLRALAQELKLSLLEDEIEIKQVFYDHETQSYIDIFKLQKELIPLKERTSLKSKIQSLAIQARNMDEVLLALFPDKGILYRSLVFKFAAYEGGIPRNVSPEAWENLYYMLCGGLASVHATNKIKRAKITGGNARLALEIAQKLQGHIHLSCPLKSMSTAENNRLLLAFEGGYQKECDKVILTIPCSTYQNIQIDPLLIPEERMKFIQRVPYGDNTKIIIPIDLNTLNVNSIMTDDVGLFFSQDSDSCTLYFSGEAGRTLKCYLKERYAEALMTLKAIYPSIIFQTGLPFIANDNNQLATYDGPVTHFWVDDPYARGSYSYRSPHMKAEINVIKDYKGERVRLPYSPVNDHIFFAREHTAIQTDFGTLEGAVESGERAARLVLASDSAVP